MAKSQALLACTCALVTAGVAHADSYELTDYSWYDVRKRTGFGIALTMGAGMSSFVNSATNDVVTSAPTWGIRLLIGSHIPIGIELAYTSVFGRVEGAFGLEGDLDGRALDGTVRWNILPHNTWTPYLFGGVSWQHYDTDADGGMFGVAGPLELDAPAYPVGLGFAYRHGSGVTVDIRGTYRIVDDPVVFADTGIELDAGEALASVGYDL